MKKGFASHYGYNDVSREILDIHERMLKILKKQEIWHE